MEGISDAEALELLHLSLTLMDAQFQYWLSVSFAVLVAAFIAGERLSFRWRVWIAFLYLLVSALFAARFAGQGIHGIGIAQELGRRGVPTPDNFATIAALLRAVIFFLGVATTSLFLFLTFPKNELGMKKSENSS